MGGEKKNSAVLCESSYFFLIINGIMHKCKYRCKFTDKVVGYYYLSKRNLSPGKCPCLDLNKKHDLDRNTTASLQDTFWLPPDFPKLQCVKAHVSRLETLSTLSNSQPKWKEVFLVSKMDYQGVFQATCLNYIEIISKSQ